MDSALQDFDEIEVSDDDWHHLEVTMCGAEVEGIVFDGDIVFATEQYMSGRTDLDDVDVGR